MTPFPDLTPFFQRSMKRPLRIVRKEDGLSFSKESSKIVLKLFLKKPSTSYETPSSYESTDTKIFKKIERELAF